MSIALIAASIRHERRIRLAFSNTLASGAFTSLAYYAITARTDGAVEPNVVKAYVLLDSPHVVELQLDADLTETAVYTASAVGVPATDLSVTPDPSEVSFSMAGAGVPVALPPPQATTSIYGSDFLFDGDYREGADGDLAEWEGEGMVQAHLLSRLLSDGLPYDPSYGLHARQYVDGATGALFELRTKAIDQMLADPRVKSAEADLDVDGTLAQINVTPTLIGAKAPQAPLSLPLTT